MALLDAVGARGESEGSLVVERNPDLAADLGGDPVDVVAPRQLPVGKPSGDALKPRPPQRARLGPLHQRRKIFLADAAQHQRRLVGKGGGKGLGKFAERIMDRGAAIRRRQRHVDGIERIQPQDIFRIDRVGIAQPVLDRRDRQLQRPRRERRLWRGLQDRLDLVGLVEFGGEADIVFAGTFGFIPARLAGDGLQTGAGSARPPPARRRPSPNGSG